MKEHYSKQLGKRVRYFGNVTLKILKCGRATQSGVGTRTMYRSTTTTTDQVLFNQITPVRINRFRMVKLVFVVGSDK